METPSADSWQPCRDNEGGPAGNLFAACSVSLRVEPRSGCEWAWPTIKRSRRSGAHRTTLVRLAGAYARRPETCAEETSGQYCMVVDLVATELDSVHERIARAFCVPARVDTSTARKAGSPARGCEAASRIRAARNLARPELDDLRPPAKASRAESSRSESALGAVRAFRPPAASSLCVLTQPRPSTEPAGESSGESRVVLHAMQLKAMAGCRQRWLYQQFRWSAVAHRRTKSLAACSRSCSRSSLGILVGPRRPTQRPRPPLPLRGERWSPHLAPARHCISMGSSVGSRARQK